MLIYLDFSWIQQRLYYYDKEFNQINNVSHFHFNGGFNDLPLDK